MERNEDQYVVVVYTKRRPESFRGPILFRNFLSALSESPNAESGSGGMSLEEAEKIAINSTCTSYVDRRNHLRSSEGIVYRVR